MHNNLKHTRPERVRTALVASAAALVMLATLLLGAPPAAAAAPPEQSPGCQTYGCLYEHCTTHYTRDGSRQCDFGVAYERLPDGPDNRRFVEVLWPGEYDPARREMWDRVAYCESTWRWAINNGNGFHGGVQFHPRTWALYGGGEFATYAFQATPEQQIAVAERVAYYGHIRPDGLRVDPQGPRAWPHCGVYLRPPAA